MAAAARRCPNSGYPGVPSGAFRTADAEGAVMNERSWGRAGAASGQVAAVLLLVSVLLNPSPPPSDEAA